MPKGKKFDAAEKHFILKEAWYSKRIQTQRESINLLIEEKDKLKLKIQELENDNEKLQDWVERLLDYTDLSQEDIKKVCEQDKRRGEELISFMGIANLFNI